MKIRSAAPSLLVLAIAALPSLAQDAGGSVSGVVKDATGAAVPKAAVSLLSGDRDVWGGAQSDEQGRFEIKRVAGGRYLLVVKAAGFSERRQRVVVEHGRDASVEVLLGAPAIEEEITVTAERGGVLSSGDAAQPVTVIGADDIAGRAKAVVAQIAEGETGVHLQRTSPTMAGIYVRGLTGKNVNLFVDGVRYSTSAQRGGVNTFLDLIDPTALESVEVLRGPQSAQYGSDALGGSVQFLTRTPSFSSGESRLGGGLAMHFNSADVSYGGSFDATLAARNFGLSAVGVGRRINTLRAADGTDSRNAVTRFLGLPADVAIDQRLPDTAFTQYGGMLKAAWSPSPGSQLRASYLRSQQDGGKRYDQLLGGDGNLVADLRNLMLDNVQLRYDRLRLGWLDELSLGASWNAQREERVNQGGNGNPRAAINHEYEKTRVAGAQATLRKATSRHSWQLGGDFYAEGVTAPSFSYNPVTGATAVRRGRVPDGASYQWGGVYLQDLFEAVPQKLQLAGAVRWSAASYEAQAADSPIVNGRPLWPDDSLDVDDVTFRAGLSFRPAPAWTLTASVGKGFRAPHVTDLGTYGLTGSGYEIAAPDVASLPATIGTSAGVTAVSTGIPVAQVEPERSLNYDVGVAYQTGKLRVRLGAFLNNVDDNIAKQALILPQGAVGTMLGDQPITAQAPGGAVFVPLSTSPVLVRANYDDARLSGIEAELEARPSARWTVSGVFSYIYAKDKRNGAPPNIEGGTPAPDGWLRVRWQSPKRGLWVEPYMHAAARQDRLSSLDLEDRRTGAPRTRASIAAFFSNGATARGLVGAGADGRLGTADDVLLATGETLPQVQNRVLGTAAGAPLYTSVDGYFMFGVRAGVRRGPHELLLDFENAGDANYRGISWGIDAPGRGLFVRYATRF
jgi:hemoglobin/transferrin/lactoferrin receptor protein